MAANSEMDAAGSVCGLESWLR